MMVLQWAVQKLTSNDAALAAIIMPESELAASFTSLSALSL